MNKKISGLSLIVVTLLIIGGFSSVIYAKETNDAQEKIIVEMKEYKLNGIDTVLTEMTTDEYNELQKDLEKISQAITSQDRQKISDYEELLYKKGVFGDKKRSLYTEYEDKIDSLLSSKINNNKSINRDNISNYLCYFHAIGEGACLFTIGPLIMYILYILDHLSIYINLFGLIAFITHIVPIRILLPVGWLFIQGRVFTLGLNGMQKRDCFHSDDIEIFICGFTGITFGIWDGDLKEYYNIFFSGFSIAAFEGNYPFT